MTSEAEATRCAVPERRKRTRSPMDQLPPPAASSKPLTPFSIEDILNKPWERRSQPLLVSRRESSPSERPLLHHSSPLCALEELASKTFRGLEVSVLQAAEGRDGLTLFGQRNHPKKRRKSRTAFTNHQIYELEKRFLYQKYLSPADRDQIAQHLGLTNAQVITWFQNRRAKLKRDLEEMKADVESARAAGAAAFQELSNLAQLESPGQAARSAQPRTEPDPTHGSKPTDGAAPPPQLGGDGQRSRWGWEEDEELEIDVDD